MSDVLVFAGVLIAARLVLAKLDAVYAGQSGRRWVGHLSFWFSIVIAAASLFVVQADYIERTPLTVLLACAAFLYFGLFKKHRLFKETKNRDRFI